MPTQEDLENRREYEEWLSAEGVDPKSKSEIHYEAWLHHKDWHQVRADIRLANEIANLENKAEQISKPETSLPENMTLGQILDLMYQMDEGLIELSFDDMKELGAKAHIKVDGYKYFFEKVDAECERLSKRIKEFQEAKRTLENKKKNLEEILKFHVKHHGLSGMSGDDYKFKYVVKKGNKTEILPGYEEPNSELYVSYTNYIKRSYRWDLTAIKKDLKTGANKGLQQIAKLVDSESINWSVNKRIDDREE